MFTASHQSSVADVLRICTLTDSLGVDLLAIEDHLLGSSGDTSANQFECWSLLGALAVETHSALLTAMVTPAPLRPAPTLAKAAVTVDHLSEGRLLMGLGTGWLAQEFELLGLSMATYEERLSHVAETVATCREIWESAEFGPAPVGKHSIPILLGGRGDGLLRLVADIGDVWNAEGPVATWADLNERLSQLCVEIGRPPDDVLRTVVIPATEASRAGDYRAAGADVVVLAVEKRSPDAAIVDAVTEAIEVVSRATT